MPREEQRLAKDRKTEESPEDREDRQLEEVRAQLRKGSKRLKITVRPEDRLAAVLNQRSQTVQGWVQLQEALDTAEMVADPDSGSATESTREAAKGEIKGILKQAAPVLAHLTALTDKAVKLAKECRHPLREDLRRGFPNDLRDAVPAGCFGEDEDEDGESKPQREDGPGASD